MPQNQRLLARLLQLYVGMSEDNRQAIEILRRWAIQDAKGTSHEITLATPAADVPKGNISRSMPKDWVELDPKTGKELPRRPILRATVTRTSSGTTIENVQRVPSVRVVSTGGGKH